MTRPIRTVVRASQPQRTPGASGPPPRQNQGWGKLVGALVFGVGGGLGYRIPGAVVGAVVGAALGHWLDLMSASSAGESSSSPLSADDLAAEANAALALEVRDAFAALDQAAGRKGAASQGAMQDYLRHHLGVADVPRQGAAIPWQQDLASACGRLAKQLDPNQRSGLLLALYQHAGALGLGPGPARLILRDGASALGFSSDQEDQIREQAGML